MNLILSLRSYPISYKQLKAYYIGDLQALETEPSTGDGRTDASLGFTGSGSALLDIGVEEEEER